MLEAPLSDLTLAASELTQPFWDAAREGRLLYQRCDGCDRAFFRPEVVCPHCRSRSWSWRESKGEGSLYSFSVMHRAPTPAFTAPFIFAAVELDEGYAMFSNLIGLEPDDARIGMRLKVAFRAVTDDATLPYFEPA
jgi:uncharacterized OB-fold protein